MNITDIIKIVEGKIFFSNSELRIARDISSVRKLGLKDSVARGDILSELDALTTAISSYMRAHYPELDWSFRRCDLQRYFEKTLGFSLE